MGYIKAKSWQLDNPDIARKRFAQRGDALYESEIRQQVEEGNHGKIVAIHIETGAFELAARELYARVPDAQPWLIRIGYRAAHHFGARSLKDSL